MGPPKISTPPPPPTINDARQDAEQSDAFLRRKGQQANMVSTEASRSEGAVGTKMLLGQGG
jgi:hypothetical protein